MQATIWPPSWGTENGDGQRGEVRSVLCIVEAKLPLGGRVPT